MACLEHLRRRLGSPILGLSVFGLACLFHSPPVTAANPGKAAVPNPVWPPPPDEPRIAYVQNISNPADAGIKGSRFRRFANWITGSEGGETLLHPFGIALDEADNPCFTDTQAHAVLFYDRVAKRSYRWEQIGNIPFVSPVAVAKKGNTLFVADSSIPAIIAFALDGKLLFRIDSELKRPSGLAISGDRLLVADAGRHCIAIYDLRGKFIGRFGERGTGPGQFNFPTHIAVDARGGIYVTDSMNGRVQVFDAKGQFARQIGGSGDGPGMFSRPKGVAVDASGRAYVVDAVFQNYQIFDTNSRLLLDVGGPGTGPGEFWLPNGIAIGRDQKIYVADCYNSRVQVFQLLGNP